MKTYIVYVDGEEMVIIRASGHNAAEAKAARMFRGHDVSVAYTEV